MASPSSSGTNIHSAFLGSFIPFPVSHARFSFKIYHRSKIVAPVTFLLSEGNGRTFWKHASDRNHEYPHLDSLEFPGKLARRSNLMEIGRFPFKSLKEILGFFENNGRYQTVFVFNEILSSLIKRDDNDLAAELYSYLPKYDLIADGQTYSLMIRCECRRNNPDKAKQILEDMLEIGYHTDVATFTLLIDLFCRNGKLQKAFEVFDGMRKIQCEPTIRVYNCLLKGLCYVGRVEEALEMLLTIKKKKSVTPDIYTYTALMDGLCKVGRSDDAKELLDEAIKMGLEPNAVTYNTLFDGYCREGRPMKGFSLLKLMERRKCYPDPITYSTFMSGLLKWGKIRAALKVYKEIGKTGLEAEERTLGCLFRRVCGKSLEERDLVEDARQLFDKMTERAVRDDPWLYSLMIRALCVGERLDEALECVDKALELGFVPRTVTFNNLVQGLSGKGKAEEALSLVLLMYEKGKIPSRTSYDGLIKELKRQGMLQVAAAVYGLALKQRVFVKY